MIFVESGCDPAQNLSEVNWISALAQNEPRLKGIVAHAPLEHGESVRAVLKTIAGCPLVKGVRRNLQGERDGEFILRTEFIAGVARLAEFGFTFDVCVRHEQLRSVAELARRIPEVTFVLDHLGKPDMHEKKSEPWATDLKAIAALPNVVCKISGLATEADWKNWQPPEFENYFVHALECFGHDRVLFGGDWPVATLATSYDDWIEAVLKFFPFVTEADRVKLFQTNAERIYRV
jgi:L-fuconolactonase